MKHCNSCGAPIYWLKNEKSGRPAPIDARTREGGNIEIDLDKRLYRVVGKRPGFPLFTNHFMTCPQAKAWANHGGR